MLDGHQGNKEEETACTEFLLTLPLSMFENATLIQICLGEFQL